MKYKEIFHMQMRHIGDYKSCEVCEDFFFGNINIIEVAYSTEFRCGQAIRIKFIRDGKKFTVIEHDVDNTLSENELTIQAIKSVLND